jgi:hypothetical protein
MRLKGIKMRMMEIKIIIMKVPNNRILKRICFTMKNDFEKFDRTR